MAQKRATWFILIWSDSGCSTWENCNFVTLTKIMCLVFYHNQTVVQLRNMSLLLACKQLAYLSPHSQLLFCIHTVCALYSPCKSAHRRWKEPLILLLYLLMQYMFTSLPDNGGAIFHAPVFSNSSLRNLILRSSGLFNGQSTVSVLHVCTQYYRLA